MVEKEVADLMLLELRKSKGFEIVMSELRDMYIRNLMKMARGPVNTVEDLVKARTSIGNITEFLGYAGMSKEEIVKWMEIR